MLSSVAARPQYTWSVNLSPEEAAAFGELTRQLMDAPRATDFLGRETRVRKAGVSKRKPPLAGRKLFTLRIELKRSKPVIWRRIVVHSDITLDLLHLVIQGAFDWMNYHLYRFAIGHPFDRHSDIFLGEWELNEGEAEGEPADEVRLDECVQNPGDTLQYVYDFGDDWGLKIRLEQVLEMPEGAPIAACVDGRRAAPPEDSGSIRTERELARVVENPAWFDPQHANDSIIVHLMSQGVKIDGSFLVAEHPAFTDIVDQFRDPLMRADFMFGLEELDHPPTYGFGDDGEPVMPYPEIDVASIDLEQEFSAVLWFLRRVGDGIKLTQAGYLPPQVVREFAPILYPERELQYMRGGESHQHQLRVFREYLQKLGLTRKSKGMLLLTQAGKKAVGNPRALWDHIADRLATTIQPVPGQRNFDRDATALTLVEVALGTGRINLSLLVERLMNTGWGHRDGSPVDSYDITWSGSSPLVLFWFMGLRDNRGWLSFPLRPAAVVLAHTALARAKRR